MKKCSKCGIKKELSDFYKDRSAKNGLRGDCKLCISNINRERYLKHPERKIRNAMIARCTNSKNKAYKYYGARGISVCPRWLASYTDFLEDMGKRPTSGHSIDRIDNEGDYEPDNCRWATAKEQAKNKRMREDNTSGYTGVCWRKRNKKWVAQIMLKGRKINLGHFTDIKDAVKAYKDAEELN